MKPVETKRDDGVELETQVILRLPEVYINSLISDEMIKSNNSISRNQLNISVKQCAKERTT